MERLTQKEKSTLSNGEEITICNHQEQDCNDSCMYGTCKWNKKALDKLKAYEDAEEQGLLLRLPYPIGMPIYKVVYSSKINDGFIYETTMSLKYYADDIKAFEKGLVYSSKEEAEQKLAEMKGE